MFAQDTVSVVIPALNEEKAIGKVVASLLSQANSDGERLIDELIVCDNGSSDNTATVAQAHGARVVCQPQPGYGIACLTAIAALEHHGIVLFVDGDDSCLASQAIDLLKPFSMHENGSSSVDMVIGSRELGRIEAGALTLSQRFGNRLATSLMGYFWGSTATDLGPYRAIRYSALHSLQMQDKRFGWTIEMQIKALQQHMNVAEVAVDSTRRIGTSKISGTLSGVIGAAKGILGMIIKLRWQQFRKRKCCLPARTKLQSAS
ncbi:glycosyltransferase family 2 protein [Pseudoteredinibacter isoporae]|uniref:glycosyltransferase family 2 protein n=1 Tax=Pseudoteredinibacter isoporae TaxID=570281 RepID=UPI0031086C2C